MEPQAASQQPVGKSQTEKNLAEKVTEWNRERAEQNRASEDEEDYIQINLCFSSSSWLFPPSSFFFALTRSRTRLRENVDAFYLCVRVCWSLSQGLVNKERKFKRKRPTQPDDLHVTSCALMLLYPKCCRLNWNQIAAERRDVFFFFFFSCLFVRSFGLE